MTRQQTLMFSGILVLMGAGWGSTQPMTKIAVSTGLGHFGLVFWQLVISALMTCGICLMGRLRIPMHFAALRLYLIIAMIGTVLPNSLTYVVAIHLPAGVMSLLLSSVPMFAFTIALGLGSETFDWRRLAGLSLGLFGVLLIVAPAADLGQGIPVFWALAYLFVACCYAFEGNFVAKWGTLGLGPFQVMAGASIVGSVISCILMIASGQTFAMQFPLDRPQGALVLSSVIHVFVYTTYVWVVGRAGAVFTAQVSYLVTGFGLFWAWVILGEVYNGLLWLALAAMFGGLYLVQPRAKEALARPEMIGEDRP